MFGKLKGLVGNVPIRLVATVLVAILVPSLLVTGLGLLAVFQADRFVKRQARDQAIEELERLRNRVATEWESRIRHFERILADAPSRRARLAGLRGVAGVEDIFLQTPEGLRTVPARLPPRTVPRAWDHPAVRRLLAAERSGTEPATVLEGWRELAAETGRPAVHLEALLGASRVAAGEGQPAEALRLLDEAIRLYADTADATGVHRGPALLLRRLELLGPSRPGERAATVRRLVALLQAPESRVAPPAAMRWLERLEELAPGALERIRGKASAAGTGPASAPAGGVLGETDRRALERALVADARGRGDWVRDRTRSIDVRLPVRGPSTFLRVPAGEGATDVLLLLDREAFLDDAGLFLEELGIPGNVLETSRGRADRGPQEEDREVVAHLALPEPFAHLEWRRRAEPGSLATGFRSLEIFTAASFTWAVIVLVLAILSGTFLSLRSVLREMATARMKSDFVSFISHEIKTPLSAIRMFSETLADGRVRDEDELRECLRMIDSESGRLAGLIDRVLEYSRIQSHQKTYDFQSCSMEEVVHDAVGIFHDHHKSAPREIEVHAVQHISKTRMDRASMVELMLNLLSNAAKYSPPDEKIMISLSESIDEITVEVVDRGTGIPKRDQRKIFDKFFRANDYLTRDVEGYGLGLAFARYIARQHKGDIKVSSQVNSGSTFTLCLKKTDVLAE